MSRELKTPRALWHQAKYLVSASIPGPAGRMIQLPEPERLDDPDSSGCNWRIQLHQAATDHVQRIETIVESMRARWNMQ